MKTDLDILFKHVRQTEPINIYGRVGAHIHLFATCSTFLCYKLTCSLKKWNCQNIPIKLSYYTPSLNVKIFHINISNVTYP